MRISMTGRVAPAASLMLAACLLGPGRATAQDIPGIEICTVEKTMERRTSCLQSNIDFLQKTMTKLAADYQQKLDAAKAQVETLKAAVVALQKTVDDLQAAQRKAIEDTNKRAVTSPVKDAPLAKEGAK
jgi:predicted transcriptional regulator